MQKNVIAFIILACTMLCPQITAAFEYAQWNFVNGANVAGWKTDNLTTLSLVDGGLLVDTETEGFLMHATDTIKAIDTVTLSFASAKDGQFLFVWEPRNALPNTISHIPVNFRGQDGLQTVSFNMNRFSNWYRKTGRVGFVFSPGTTLVVQDITMEGYSWIEKAVNAWKTAWALDSMRPYSVNFLWGPMMTFSPLEMQNLYKNFPPVAVSANRALYVILALGLIYVFVRLPKLRGKPEARYRVIVHFFLLFAGLWLLYDVRMGLEPLNQFMVDYKEYHSQQPGKATFRDRSYFNQFADDAATLVDPQEQYYAFVARHDWPFVGRIKYATYPSLPVIYDRRTAEQNIKTWVVFNRQDIVQDTEGRLRIGDEILTEPGTILHQFMDGTFVFREHS